MSSYYNGNKHDSPGSVIYKVPFGHGTLQKLAFSIKFSMKLMTGKDRGAGFNQISRKIEETSTTNRSTSGHVAVQGGNLGSGRKLG